MTLAPKRTPVRRLTDAEEAALQARIAADPENPELTDAQLAEMKPAAEALTPALYEALVKRGRPKAEIKRQPVTLKMDPRVIATFKAGGAGWQTRMNEALRLAAATIEKRSRAQADAVRTEVSGSFRVRGGKDGKVLALRSGRRPSGEDASADPSDKKRA